jgi:Sulfotransferase family
MSEPSAAGGQRRPVRRRVVTAALRVMPPVRRVVEQRDEHAREAEQLRRKNARLRERNRALREELRETGGPAASPSGRLQRQGHREDLGFLFVVTYGRSGSTLLQGILSSIPGYLIRGENGGVAYQLYKFHAIATRHSASKGGSRWRSPQSAWFGIGGYPQETALQEMRRLLLTTVIRPRKDSRVVGFKEIKWLQDDLHDYVEFLQAVFPGARFVVNTRNLDDVVASKWWAKDSESRQVLDEAEARMLKLVDRLGDCAYHIRYDDYVHDPGKLRGLFEWLGEELDEAQVAEVMAKRHSY